jgi:hypothetical protein
MNGFGRAALAIPRFGGEPGSDYWAWGAGQGIYSLEGPGFDPPFGPEVETGDDLLARNFQRGRAGGTPIPERTQHVVGFNANEANDVQARSSELVTNGKTSVSAGSTTNVGEPAEMSPLIKVGLAVGGFLFLEKLIGG